MTNQSSNTGTGKTPSGTSGAPAQRDIAKSDRGIRPDSTTQMPETDSQHKKPGIGSSMQRTHRSAGA